MKGKIVIQQWINWLILASVLVVACVVFPSSGKAQSQTTSVITGRVTDQSGAVIPDADVVATNQNTGAVRNAKTNSTGDYSIPGVLPGVYRVKVSKDGFETAVVTNRSVENTRSATVDVQLKVGSATQTVTVSAKGAELLTTGTAEIGGNLSPQMVKSLPNIRGNFFDLLALAPGTVPESIDSYGGAFSASFPQSAYNYVNVGNTKNNAGVFIGGNRDSAANVSVDGSNVQNPVYQDTPQLQASDTVQELRVQSSGMNAEFGYGASGVNVITKSGTNQIHGDVYEYLRNNAADANGFFNNLFGQKIPHYEQNQFGVSAGGPIKKDKLLYFFNYEGLRAIQGQNVQTGVVPDSYRNGDFSFNPFSTPQNPQPVIPVYNPYQYNQTTGLRQQFPGNIIPLGATTLCAPKPTCVDPADLKFLQQWVLPANATLNGVPYFIGTSRNTIDSDQETLRIDFLQSDKSTIYGRFTHDPTSGIAGSVDPLGGTFNNHGSDNAVVHWIRTLSSNAVNHFFAGYTRPTWFLGRNNTVPNVSQDIGIANTSNLPGGPDFSGTGFDMDTSGVFILKAVSNRYQLNDDLSLVHGSHTMKFGIDLINNRFGYTTTSDDKGVFNFNGQYTTACPPGNATCAAAATTAGLTQGGIPFADYLLGATNSNFVQLNPAPYAAHQLYTGFYAEDSWRVASKLTLNYGLRYEHWTAWELPRNTVLSLDAATGNPVYVLQNPLDYLSPSTHFGRDAKLNPSLPRGGYAPGTKDFGPRVGFAYQILPNTVIRANYGIFYDGNRNDNQFSNIQTGGPPFTLTVNQPILANDFPVPTYTVSNNFPASALSPAALPTPGQNPPVTYRSVLNHMPTASVQQWNFNIEQRVGQIWGLTVGYMGSHTLHEFEFVDENAPVLPQGQYANVSLQNRRRFPGYGILGTWDPMGWARYNAMLVSFHNSSPYHGLSLVLNFTWAKNIASSLPGFSDLATQDFRNPYIWAGPTNSTPPKFVTVGYVYDLPVGRGMTYLSSMNPILNGFIGGWQLSGITTISAGDYEPFFNSTTSAGTGFSWNMPNRVAGCNPNDVPGGKSYLRWFNPDCFTPAAFGTYGNSTFQGFNAPGFTNFDMGIRKIFKTGFPKESGNLEVRIDMFNAFNHTQFAPPTVYSTVGEAQQNIGRINGTRPARQMQFGLKYVF